MKYIEPEREYIDTSTKLMWRMGPYDIVIPINWMVASKWIKSLGSYWRLPSIDELKSLHQLDRMNHNLPNEFQLKNTNGWLVWSNEKLNNTQTWYFDFSVGFKKHTRYWCQWPTFRMFAVRDI